MAFARPSSPERDSVGLGGRLRVTPGGDVVLVSQDGGKVWGPPGGKPEGDEDWRATMEREVLEEACVLVEDATLLGFSKAEVVKGPEEGLVLVRALWRADVSLLPWDPRHEITHRILVQPQDVLAQASPAEHRLPILRRWLDEALIP